MMRLLTIAKLNLLELLRDRGELISATVLPLLLTWVFSTAFGSTGVERAIKIPVTDLDGSSYSAALIAHVDDSEAFDVIEAGEQEARATVGDGDAPVAVIVPAGFGDAVEDGQAASVAVLRYPGSVSAQAAVTVVEGAARRIEANATAARVTRELLEELPPGGLDASHIRLEGTDDAQRHGGPARLDAATPAEPPSFSELYKTADGFWEPEPPVAVKVTTAQAAAEKGEDSQVPANVQYSIGFTVFFVFMVGMGSAGGVLEDRELGTLRRLLAAPLRRSEILGGKVLGVAAVAAAQAGLLVGVGALVFGVPWGEDPLAVTALLLGLVFSATGLGVMISALVRTRGQMSALVPIVSTALAMIGGCYWDLSMTTEFMQKLALFTPTGWAMIGFTDVVARGAGLEDVLLPVGILAVFSVVTLAIGTTRLRLE